MPEFSFIDNRTHTAIFSTDVPAKYPLSHVLGDFIIYVGHPGLPGLPENPDIS